MPDTPALERTYAESADLATKLAEWFWTMLAETPVSVDVDANELLVGPSRMNCQAAWDKHPGACGADGYHCPLGTKQLLALGLAGIAETAAANAAGLAGAEADYLFAIARCYEAACSYVSAWADAAADAADAAVGDNRLRLTRIAGNCRALAEGPPADFHSAVQLLMFALPMRNGPYSTPPGRLDVHLQPFYAADLQRGSITPEFAQELIDELFVKMDKMGAGDGLMNLVVGGVDAEGNDATNDVSFMMVDAATRLCIASPLMNIRVHARTPEDFRRKLTELQLARTGGCTVLNDEVIIPAFVAEGIAPDLARNYCCDGCNELLFDGESLIDFTMVEAAKSLEVMLFNGRECPLPAAFVPQAKYHYARDDLQEARTGLELGYATGDFTKMTSFEEVFEAYVRQYVHQLRCVLRSFCDGIRRWAAESMTDLFFAGTFPECLATGRDPLCGGARHRTFMVFAGSLPTVADGLAAIKRVVFEDRASAPGELLAALKADWEGYEPLRRHCLGAPKFGNDDPFVDEIAAELVRRYEETVRSFDHHLPYPVLPALFCHTFNLISMTVNATPDGRKRGDPVAEHFSPVPGRAVSGPTAVINSMTRAPLHRMTGTAVTHVSLSRSALGTPAQATVLVRTLLDTALEMGLTVANFPIYDVEQMIDAQVHPECHADLMVRVWGFSDRFTTLDKRLQDHLIARAVKSQEG